MLYMYYTEKLSFDILCLLDFLKFFLMILLFRNPTFYLRENMSLYKDIHKHTMYMHHK